MSFTISINDQAAFEVQFAGPAGPTGPQGPQGIQGVPGEGVAVGGTTGQVLKKASNADYDTVWSSDISGVSWGGITGTLSAQTDLQNALDAKLSTSSASSTYLPLAGGYITGDLQSNNGSAYRSWNGSQNIAVLKSDYLQLTYSGSGGNALTVEWNGITFADGKQTVRYPGTGVLDGLYYPLSSNPAGYLTSAALSGYATESWVTTQLGSYLTISSAASTYAPLSRGLPASGSAGQVLTKVNGTDYNASWTTIIPGDRYLTTSTTSLTVGNGTKNLTVETGLSYSPQQDIVISYDGTAHMHAVVTSYNSSTGAMVVDVTNHTGSGTYANWTVNVGGTVPLQSIAWGDITGTLGSQTDLATALNAKANLSGSTFTGKVNFVAGTTSSSSINLAPGVAPTAPLTGDLWFDSSTSKIVFRSSALTQAIASELWVTAQNYVTPSYLDGYASESWVTSGFYPLSNPSGFIDSSALSGYATEYWVSSNYYSNTNPSAFIGDAPADGTTYGRQNNAWVATGGGGGSSPYQAIVDSLALFINVTGVQCIYDPDPANNYDQGYTLEVSDAAFLNSITRYASNSLFNIQIITKTDDGTVIMERSFPLYASPSTYIPLMEYTSSAGYSGHITTYVRMYVVTNGSYYISTFRSYDNYTS